MAFENLSERLQKAIRMFRNGGKITEDDLKAPLREVRMALLEADVNFKVVKDFVATIRERAVGEIVNEGLTPGQQIIKIVNEELTKLLGGTQSKLAVSPKPPTVINGRNGRMLHLLPSLFADEYSIFYHEPPKKEICCAKKASTPCWLLPTFTARQL